MHVGRMWAEEDGALVELGHFVQAKGVKGFWVKESQTDEQSSAD